MARVRETIQQKRGKQIPQGTGVQKGIGSPKMASGKKKVKKS